MPSPKKPKSAAGTKVKAAPPASTAINGGDAAQGSQAQQQQQRVLKTRSQKAGLQVRVFRLVRKHAAAHECRALLWSCSSLWAVYTVTSSSGHSTICA